MDESEADREVPERKKVRVRVMKASRTWRWKVLAALCLAGLMLAVCVTYVPRWLGSLVEGSGGGAAPAETPSQ